MVAPSGCNIGSPTPNSGWVPKLMGHPAGTAWGTLLPALPVAVPTSSESPIGVVCSISTAGTGQPGLLQHEMASPMNGNRPHRCSSPSVHALSHLHGATPLHGCAPLHIGDLHHAGKMVAMLCTVAVVSQAATTSLLQSVGAGKASSAVVAADTDTQP